MAQNLMVVLDEASADRLLAVRKKLFLSKTAAVKMAILITYNKAVLGIVDDPIPENLVSEHAQDMISTTGMGKIELETVLGEI